VAFKKSANSAGPKSWSVAELGAFYTENRAELLAHANRVLKDSAKAEEITQDALIKFMLAAPELESKEHGISYLHRTIENLCIDYFRAEGRRPNLVVIDDAQAEVEANWQDNGDHAEVISAAEDAAIIRQALALLSPAERAALVMWEMEGRSTAEIAAELGIKESAVRHTVSRARASLRRVLTELVIDEKRGLTALDMLSTSYKKAAKIAEKTSKVALSLIMVLTAFLGFNSLTGSEVQTTINNVKPTSAKPFTTKVNKKLSKKSNSVDKFKLVTELQMAEREMKSLSTQVVALRSQVASIGWSAIGADGAPIGFTSNDGSSDYYQAALTTIPVASDDVSGINSSVFTVSHLDEPVRIAQDIEVVNGELVVSIQPVFVAGSDLIAPALVEESMAVTTLADGSKLVTVWQTLDNSDVASVGASAVTVKIRVSSDGKVLSESARIIPTIKTTKQASV